MNGATTFDPTGLLVAELNDLESAAILTAAQKHLRYARTRPETVFDFCYLLELHRDMFGTIWGWAGQTRRFDLNIGIPWLQVEVALYDLSESLPYWSSSEMLVEQAARLHHSLVRIHPFRNGNGRWARLAADIWSRRHGGPLVSWPVDIAGVRPDSPVRAEYITAIKSADAGD